MNLYLLLFSCGVFATFPNESIVTLPIERCLYGDRCLNVTLLPRNFSIQAVLTLSDVFVFNSRIHAIYSSHVRIPNIPDIVSENHLLSSATHPSLGIGPRSPLITLYGSASLLFRPTNNDSLVLGLSETQFKSTCIPNSTLSLSLSDPTWMVEASVDVISSDGLLNRPILEIEPFYANIFKRRNSFPRPIVQSIWEHLQASGASFGPMQQDQDDGLVMTNCSRSAIESAPWIRFSFTDGREHIFLHPSDYIYHEVETNSCTLLFRLVESASMWSFAPLTIPETNVFVNQTCLLICDSFFGLEDLLA